MNLKSGDVISGERTQELPIEQNDKQIMVEDILIATKEVADPLTIYEVGIYSNCELQLDPRRVLHRII